MVIVAMMPRVFIAPKMVSLILIKET